jgi:acetyl-CoA C-acetyltransferase
VDIDVYEVNEAFDAQALAVIRDANLDPGRVNPVRRRDRSRTPSRCNRGDSFPPRGQRLVRRDLELGVMTMCIGGGRALAAVLFRRAA